MGPPNNILYVDGGMGVGKSHLLSCLKRFNPPLDYCSLAAQMLEGFDKFRLQRMYPFSFFTLYEQPAAFWNVRGWIKEKWLAAAHSKTSLNPLVQQHSDTYGAAFQRMVALSQKLEVLRHTRLQRVEKLPRAKRRQRSNKSGERTSRRSGRTSWTRTW